MACELTYVTQADLKGSLPTSITKMVTVQQPMCIDGIRKVLSKEDLSKYIDQVKQAAEPEQVSEEEVEEEIEVQIPDENAEEKLPTDESSNRLNSNLARTVSQDSIRSELSDTSLSESRILDSLSESDFQDLRSDSLLEEKIPQSPHTVTDFNIEALHASIESAKENLTTMVKQTTNDGWKNVGWKDEVY